MLVGVVLIAPIGIALAADAEALLIEITANEVLGMTLGRIQRQRVMCIARGAL